MTKRIHGLGTLQTEVMEIVWKQQEATVAAVAEAIGRKRPVTYTTVLSAMQKLEKKGWLQHRAAGRAYIYSPTQNLQQVGGRGLRELLKTAFQGDPRLLLASLLDETRLSTAELKELRELIDERRKETLHD